MKLSKRLETIASLIPNQRNIIDVGCDHGLLDISIALKENINITATDISPKAIENAKQNAKNYNVYNKIKFIVTDGLNNIDIKEDDVLIISGMGAHTMIDILKDRKLPSNIILSAHRDIELIRRFLVSLGYYIKEEKVVFEKKWYVILLFEKGIKKYTEDDYILGVYAKENKEYLNYLLKKEQYIEKRSNKKSEKLKKIEKYL